MIAVLLHILFTTGFGLIVKNADTRGQNLWAVGAVNYVVAAILALIFLFRLTHASTAPNGFSTPTVIVAVLGGIGYVVSFFFLCTLVMRDGISIAMAIARLSVMIPVVFSIIYWREQPNTYQILGIILVCLSLPLLSQNQAPRQIPKGNRFRQIDFRGEKPVILALFLVTGWCSLSSKMFVQVSPQEPREVFLAFLYSTAGIISIVSLIIHRTVPTRRDILHGILLGSCNILGNNFLLIALGNLPGMLVFPISSSSGVVLNTLAAVMVWRETLRRPAIAGIVTTVAALVLINLK